nr:hypothetical protein [Tanacetum cinerariifolium]
MSIDDGVIRHTYCPKPRAKAYLENFEIDEEDDCLSCFEVGRDEDCNPNYGLVYFWCNSRTPIGEIKAMESIKSLKVTGMARQIQGMCIVKGCLSYNKKSIGTPRVVDWTMFYVYSFDETLKYLMKMEYLHSDGDMFVDYSWERALSIKGDTYQELCFEFFSTMCFERGVDRTKIMTKKCVWFGLYGREHVLSLPGFVVILGLYEPSELDHRLFAIHFSKLEIDNKLFDHDAYWKKVGKPTKTNRRTSLIREPLIRVVHRLIVGALVHRLGTKERCQKRDLWMMSALEESCGINLAWIIPKHRCKHAPRLEECWMVMAVVVVAWRVAVTAEEWGRRRCHFARECRASRNQENRNRDAPTRNASAEEELINFSLMAYTSQGSSSSSRSDSEVHTCSKECLKSYDALQKQHDQQREALNESNLEIIDKTGLGYDGQMNKSDLNDIHVNESDVLNNVVDSCESDGDDNQVNDRFKKGEEYHAVLPLFTRNYMPPRADLSFAGLNNSVFKSKDWESDSKDENVFEPKEVKKTVKPSLEKIEFVNYRNTTVENENKARKPRKFSQIPRGKITGPKEIRPVLDNTARVNHQNKLSYPHPKRNFVPAAVLTKFGQVPVNTAKQSSHRAAASVSTARHVNTTTSRPSVNNVTYFYFKAHSPVRRPFNQKSAAKTNNFNEKVNTAKVNNVTTVRPKAVVSAAEGDWNNVVKSSACWIWRPKGNLIDHISKDSGSYTFKRFNYVDPQGRLKKPALSFMRPFGCSVTILNTLDHLGQAGMKSVPGPQYVLLPLLASNSQGPKNSEHEVADDVTGKKSTKVPRKENRVQDPAKEGDKNDQENDIQEEKEHKGMSLKGIIPINDATLPNANLPIDPLMPDLEDTANLQNTGILKGAYDDEVKGAEADFNNLKLT